MNDLKKIPHGVWLHLSRFPYSTTEEDVARLMQDAGLAISAEQISCKPHNDSTSVIISIDAQTVRDLVAWALQILCPVPGEKLKISNTGQKKRK